MTKRRRNILARVFVAIAEFLAVGAWLQKLGEDPDNQGGAAFALLALLVVLCVVIVNVIRAVSARLVSRRLRITLVSSSLALCLLSLGMWGVSYFWYTSIVYTSARDQAGFQRTYGLGAGLGSLVIARASADSHKVTKAEFPKSGIGVDRVSPNLVIRNYATPWFSHNTLQVNGYRNDSIGIPLWFLVLIFSILPLWSLRKYLRARREKKKGLCPHCGYDLRATPDRCPECGRLPAPRAIS